jgi:hypothetical protein
MRMKMKMKVPRIIQRSIIESKKPSGTTQYLMTIPIEFAKDLKKKGVDKLLVVYDGALAVFPDTGPEIETAILEFLTAYPELMERFSNVQESDCEEVRTE